jgi:hypothetical protein
MQNNAHPRAAIPWRGLLAVVGLALAIVLLLALRDTFDPLRRAEAERLAWQRAQIDAQLTTVDLFVAALWRLAPPALGLGLAGAAGYVGLVLVYNRWADREAIKADKVIGLAQANAQRFPAGLQSLSFHDSSRPQIVEPPPVEAAPLQLMSPIPTFGELLDAGKVGPGKPLILGFGAETGQPVEGNWDRLYSCGIGALQGAGKSWLLAFLLTQCALQDGKLIVCDPHAGDDESLATRIAALSSVFLCGVAQSQHEILDALKLANDKLKRRMDGHAARWPIVVVVDEWTSLLRGDVGRELQKFALDVSEQGRKYNINALLSAQGWTKSTTGEVRDRLTAHYVLRQRTDQARYQLDMSVEDDVRMLPDAHAYFLSTRDPLRKVVIPRMTTADIERVGAMLASSQRAARPLGFQLPKTTPLVLSAQAPTEPLSDSNGTATGQQRDSKNEMLSTAAVPPEAARAAALFLGGQDIPAIVQEMRGIDPSKGGRRYREAAKEISDLLRQAMHQEEA